MTASARRPLTVPLVASAGPPRVRIIAIPAAGRGAGAFSAWRRHVPVGAELWGVRLPGRESAIAEPPATSMDEVAAWLAENIDRVGRDRPCAPVAFVGHSLGAYVGYATASVLAERGVALAPLVVAASGAPHVPAAKLRHLLDDRDLVAELSAFGGMPRELIAEPELLRLFLPTIRADFQLVETYSPEPRRLPCDITAFAAADDDTVAMSDVVAWDELTTGRLDVHMTSGGHFFPDWQAAAIMSRAMP